MSITCYSGPPCSGKTQSLIERVREHVLDSKEFKKPIWLVHASSELSQIRHRIQKKVGKRLLSQIDFLEAHQIFKIIGHSSPERHQASSLASNPTQLFSDQSFDNIAITDNPLSIYIDNFDRLPEPIQQFFFALSRRGHCISLSINDTHQSVLQDVRPENIMSLQALNQPPSISLVETQEPEDTILGYVAHQSALVIVDEPFLLRKLEIECVFNEISLSRFSRYSLFKTDSFQLFQSIFRLIQGLDHTSFSIFIRFYIRDEFLLSGSLPKDLLSLNTFMDLDFTELPDEILYLQKVRNHLSDLLDANSEEDALPLIRRLLNLSNRSQILDSDDLCQLLESYGIQQVGLMFQSSDHSTSTVDLRHSSELFDISADYALCYSKNVQAIHSAIERTLKELFILNSRPDLIASDLLNYDISTIKVEQK